MACEHKHLKSVNCILFCLDCGAQLPPEYNAPKPAQEEKPTKKTTKKRSEGK